MENIWEKTYICFLAQQEIHLFYPAIVGRVVWSQLTLGKTRDTPVIVLSPSQSSSFVVGSSHTHECNFNLGLLIWGFLSLATLHLDQTLLVAINKLGIILLGYLTTYISIISRVHLN